jgi:hypothetical protein
MNEQTRSLPTKDEGPIKLPAYPFSGRELFNQLRRRIEEQFRVKLTVRRLAKMLGMSPSTIQYWLGSCPHPQLIGFMSLLERLSPPERHAFIDEHGRILPSFTHPWLADNAESQPEVFGLLSKQAGLTLIGGGIESSRRFVLSAFGHAYSAINARKGVVLGIDLHCPTDFVPIESLYYIDGSLGLDHVRASVNKVWPKLLTSKGPLLLFNRIWSALPELRTDIIRLIRNKHVVLADEELPGPADLRGLRSEIHQLITSPKRDGSQQIRLTFRRVSFKKP